MNKLNLYMRAVVVTALLVVGGLGVYKGRNLLSGQKSASPGDPSAQPENSASPAAEIATTDPTASPSGEKKGGWGWFSGWFGSAKPKIMEGGKEIGPNTIANAENANAPSSTGQNTTSMLGKLKFGNPSTSAAATNDTSAPPTAPPNLATSSGAGDLYGAAPAANEYGAAPTPPPAFAGYGNSGDLASSQEPPPAAGEAVNPTGDYAVVSPPPTNGVATEAPPSAPITNNLRDSLPPETALPADNTYSLAATEPPANIAATEPPPLETSPVNVADVNPAVELPRNDVPVAPPRSFADNAPVASTPVDSLPATSSGLVASNEYAPTTPLDANPPAATNAASRLNDYAPTRPPATSAASMPSPLETSLPAAPITPSARYANEVPAMATPLAAAATSVPVDPQLQGPQTPSIVLEKFAPPEVQVGRAAVFEILVKNVGQVSAYDVQVVDEIPHGTRYEAANPQPSQTQGSKGIWKLGAMKPGDEKVIELRHVPVSEGEIGSVAQVSFQAQVGAKSVVTRPKLEVRHQAPAQIHAGENATISLTIANSGSGAANGVYLESDIPAGFAHPAGPSLEYEVGTLRPGESKTIELVLRADKAGQYQTPLVVRGEGDLLVQDNARIEVIAPSLQLQVQGPKKRFVERQSTHTLTIANPGTAPAKNVEVIAQLPRGFKFISADHQGEYDARQHAVYWALEELPPSSSGAVQLTTLPIEAGDQQILVEGQAGGGLTAQTDYLVAVDAISELPFTVADLADPIEVNSETMYEVRVANRGAKEATNVRISATFPNDIRPLEGDGAAQAKVAGQKVEFAPIGIIAPGSEAVVKIAAQGLRAGDHRVAITVVSDEHPQPVTREEGTRVYLDQ